jgi:hypothetical protein
MPHVQAMEAAINASGLLKLRKPRSTPSGDLPRLERNIYVLRCNTNSFIERLGRKLYLLLEVT